MFRGFFRRLLWRSRRDRRPTEEMEEVGSAPAEPTQDVLRQQVKVGQFACFDVDGDGPFVKFDLDEVDDKPCAFLETIEFTERPRALFETDHDADDFADVPCADFNAASDTDALGEPPYPEPRACLRRWPRMHLSNTASCQDYGLDEAFSVDGESSVESISDCSDDEWSIYDDLESELTSDDDLDESDLTSVTDLSADELESTSDDLSAAYEEAGSEFDADATVAEEKPSVSKKPELDSDTDPWSDADDFDAKCDSKPPKRRLFCGCFPRPMLRPFHLSQSRVKESTKEELPHEQDVQDKESAQTERPKRSLRRLFRRN